MFVNVYSRKQNNKRNIALSPNLVKLLNNLYQQQKEFCRQHNLPFNDEGINIISLSMAMKQKITMELRRLKSLTIAKQCGTSAKMIEQYYDQSSHLADMKQLFIKPIQVAV